MEALVQALVAGVSTTLGFFWESLYGLIFGFLFSAIAQVVVSRRAMERALGPGLRGIASGALLGIVASACSYGAAAAARGFYQKGADVRAVFAFLISSTNMNVAILIMFGAMLGWRFAVAEFFGGAIIIAVVALGATLVLRDDLRARGAGPATGDVPPARVTECLQCGMDGEPEHAVAYGETTYLFCGNRHAAQFREDPASVLAAARADDDADARGLAALRERATWRAIFATLRADVEMLRGEIAIGFVVAGFAAALVPAARLAGLLHAIGSAPFVGYGLLLLAGLGLAIVTFVCSMGNVPIARFLASAGIPLGANTTFIYGDLLIPPLLGIYRKSFPPKVVWTFVGFFVAGALLAGAIMDASFGRGATAAPAMGLASALEGFTLVANAVAAACLLTVALVARGGRAETGGTPVAT